MIKMILDMQHQQKQLENKISIYHLHNVKIL
jgi:hypothetical protein